MNGKQPQAALKSKTVKQLKTTARAAVVMDIDQNKIISEKNDKQPLAIASISKLMTGYLVLKKIPLTTVVQPTTNTMAIGEESNLSSVNLSSNETYSADELLQAALQLSANDAAIALGDQVSGTQTKFVRLMTKTSQSWGLTSAKWYNAAGIQNDETLDDGIAAANRAENTMSARDVAIMTRKILAKEPKIKNILNEPQIQFDDESQDTNFVLMQNYFENTKYTVTGAKLGVSEKSGVSYVGLFTYQGKHYITVVLHADRYTNVPAVFRETKRILNQTI
ncbi:hypothetical protein GCM10025879_10780 [Leuconostoc litchii]|nr:hypothetical protein GCM10025879_10780 [Leuconostoc litchii]